MRIITASFCLCFKLLIKDTEPFYREPGSGAVFFQLHWWFTDISQRMQVFLMPLRNPRERAIVPGLVRAAWPAEPALPHSALCSRRSFWRVLFHRLRHIKASAFALITGILLRPEAPEGSQRETFLPTPILRPGTSFRQILESWLQMENVGPGAMARGKDKRHPSWHE